MTFAYPFALAIPVLFLFMTVRRTAERGVPFPSTSVLERVPASFRMQIRSGLLGLLATCVVLTASLAAARPQRVTVLDNEEDAHNLVLSLDVSRSMIAQDFPVGFRVVDRLSAVKQVVSTFIRERQHERVGLVVFGNSAFVQSPPTRDMDLVGELVEALQVGVAGDGTAMGDGLGLAVKMLDSVPGTTKAIIMLTDGVNTAGKVSPLQAAKVAQDLGIKVHTVGIGSKDGESPGLLGGMLSLQMNPGMEFDEKTLKEIAEMTGGVYFHAADLEGLKKVYNAIDQLEKTTAQAPQRQIVEELFAPFSAACAALLALLIMAKATFLRKLTL